MLIRIVPVLGLLLLLASCGDGSESSSPPASQTFQAIVDEAQRTPVSEPVLAYSEQLCDPLRALFNDAADILETFDALEPAAAEPTSEEQAFEAALDAMGRLEEPVDAFISALEDVDPPGEVAEFHAALIAELQYGLEGLRALSEGGILGALALPSPPPSPAEPQGFQAGLIRQCGADLQEFVERFGADFLNLGTGDSGAAPPATGAPGEAVESGDFRLVVEGIEDPYAAQDEFFQPAAGNRWVAVGVALTNVSNDDQPIFSFDFTLRDAGGASYDSAYIDLPDELDYQTLAPNETARGRLGFEVPEAAEIAQVVYDPDFGDHVIEIDLQ